MEAINSWLAHPFSPDMNVGRWILFFGLLLFISMFWGVVLYHLGGGSRS